MDDHDLEVTLAGIIQELPEDWSAGNGFDVSRFAFLTVDPDWFPPPIFTVLPE
jgi:hypothetical protein